MIDDLRSLVGLHRKPTLGGLVSWDAGERPLESPGAGTSPGDRYCTSEERLLALLEASEGRTWQQRLVAETGYSEPHVSRMLCRMEDEWIVRRYWRRGQKVVVLDEAATEAVSPGGETS